jgi:hypothetical protein
MRMLSPCSFDISLIYLSNALLESTSNVAPIDQVRENRNI